MGRYNAVILLAVTAGGSSLLAQEQVRRASIRNIGGDWGKCTIEVEVDAGAEVSVSGDQGRLRTLSGRPARWRRFECSGPIPARPADFRFRGIDGRGRVGLVRDPRDNRGTAVVRIEDSQGGREGYTFDLEWRGVGGGVNGGGPPPEVWGGRPGAREDAVRWCQTGVVDRLQRDGFRDVRFRRTDIDDRPGRRDSIVGRATARDRRRQTDFDFSCSVDFREGRVRSVDVVRH